MSYEDDDSFEHTLLVVREVSVYKIPPRSSSGGYKCGEWLQSDKIWTGRLKVLSLKDKCEVRLEDSNTGELFAACPVLPGKRDATVENVTDSSRYFVLRIDDGRGKHAFIGLGFAERNEAFDFNVALSDHEKYAKRELDEESVYNDSGNSSTPALDLRLKRTVISGVTVNMGSEFFVNDVNHSEKLISFSGETIRINVKTLKQPASGPGMLSSSGQQTPVPKAMMGALAPPPGGGRIRSPLPPPPNDTRPIRSPHQAYVTTTTSKSHAQDKKPERSLAGGDSLSDMSSLKANLPSSTRASSGSASSSWAAF